MKAITIGGITIGQSSGNYKIREALGFGMADVEIVKHERPGYHGSKVPRALWRARTMRVLVGVKSSTISDYNIKRRALLAALDLPRDGLSTMLLTTTDDLDLQCDVQLAGKVDAPLLRGEVTIGNIWVPLISPDPNFYSQTEDDDDITFVAGSGVISNGGNAPVYPVIRVHGDVSGAITITNTTLSRTVSFTGLSLATGEYMDIDMLNETVTKNDDTNLYSYINADDFWWLGEGNNTITISATVGGSGNRKITVTRRAGYIGI